MKNKVLTEEQKECTHEFECIVSGHEKTLEGYYKNEKDYREGEMYNIYFCSKCGLLVTIDYSKDDDSKVREFENLNNISNNISNPRKR